MGQVLKSEEQTEKEAETQDTCQPLDYNNGDCVGKNTCFECDFTGKKILPANKDRFPTGFLQCQGDSTTCNTADAGATIKFRSSLDYLYCKGAGTCSDTWNVENAGAACCAYRGSCQGSKISLTPASDPDGGCQNDMCCDGIDSCSEGELKGIESLTCRGNRACSSATVEVSRDLLELAAEIAMAGRQVQGSPCALVQATHVAAEKETQQAPRQFLAPTEPDGCREMTLLSAQQLGRSSFSNPLTGSRTHQGLLVLSGL
ncbi:unnamed protein product [Durusdinium trenchii]